jgi:glycosyltransferase involved in cell wall biosynthesis
MRILFASRNFDRMAGGIERMATWMMNEMDKRGHDIALLTWDNNHAVPHYDISSRIEWHKLNIGDPVQRANWRLRLRRQLSIRNFVKTFKPDIIICFQSGTFIAVRTAITGLDIPAIAAERNSPDLYTYIKYGRVKYIINMLLLLLATRITVQLSSYITKYPVYLRSRIESIPNPVNIITQIPYPNETSQPPKVILNLGRLSYQKNQEFLLHSFSLIAGKYPDWQLVFVGDGENSNKLHQLTTSLELDNQVQFVGAKKNVSKWYEKSSFLAFPSLWEGFPNALTEAFSHGLPAVGLNSTAGVNELIIPGETGLLSNSDETSYSIAMEQLIVDLPLRQSMGRKAAASITFYSSVEIMDKWVNIFTQYSKDKGK